jgi:rSAM/selenodomain-associated transferase 1
MSDNLVIFTRFPVPGKTKTRLIPALGATAAAELQRRLTEHTLATVEPLGDDRDCAIEIRYAGATLPVMRTWLGDQHTFRSQCDGDLGARMGDAFIAAFEHEAKRCVIIGIDCPTLGINHVRAAFNALRTSDLVLGPATDGGYYLVGLTADRATTAIPALFEGMQWGTDTVLERTRDRATQQKLSIALLEPLDDVDRPEDLAQLELTTLAARTKPDRPDADHA